MSIDTSSVYEKVKAGEYENKLPYPSKKEMSLKQLQMARDKWWKEENRLEEQFWIDLAECLEVSRDDPFFNLMVNKSWKDGRSNGLSEVLICFDGLIPMFELYRKRKK